MIVFFFINNQTHIVWLVLDLVQLRIQRPDTALIYSTVRLSLNSPDFSFNSLGSVISIGYTIQFVQPPQYLAVGQRDYFIISTCLRDRELKLPPSLPKATAVNLIDKSLACLLFSQYVSLLKIVNGLARLLKIRVLRLLYISSPFFIEALTPFLNQVFWIFPIFIDREVVAAWSLG